jgi:hypothetical protein
MRGEQTVAKRHVADERKERHGRNLPAPPSHVTG